MDCYTKQYSVDDLLDFLKIFIEVHEPGCRLDIHAKTKNSKNKAPCGKTSLLPGDHTP